LLNLASPVDDDFAFLQHRVVRDGSSVVVGLRSERRLVLALTMILTVVSLQPPGPPAAAASVVALALTVVAWRNRAPAASALGLLFVSCLVLALVGVGPQQVVFAIAFAVYAAFVLRIAWLRPAAQWLAVGRRDGAVLALGAAIAGISGAALLIWHAVARPDLDDLVRTFVPDWPIWMLVPAAIAFSAVNAVVEEAAYRGVVLGALETALGAGAAALGLQAVAFAALHYQAGFPRGIAGFGLALVYGLALGLLRRHARGLAAPIVAHVLTDLVIVTIVLGLVRRG
jgi:membrane protease YdiL (CAAX protease family)